MAAQASSGRNTPVYLNYNTLRSVNSPEDTQAGRKRYCGVAPANSFFALNTDENVRAFLGRDEIGGRRKSTKVNMAIRETLSSHREDFTLLNSGIVIVARDAKVDDNSKPPRVALFAPSIINGAQTQGVLLDYFSEHAEDADYPSVNFELIVTDDEELIGDISIARNYQNEVSDLSIFGRLGRFDELQAAMSKHDRTIKLRTSETDYGPEFLDTEKLIQVLTAVAPTNIRLPSAEKRTTKTAETIYRVYAYRHRSRCLTDFAAVMDEPKRWPEAHRFFLDISGPAWDLYCRFKGEQAFSRLQCVKGTEVNGKKRVSSDGVPDGIIFPMLSAMSRFISEHKGRWRLAIPHNFPWQTFFQAAILQETGSARNNPQTMGKNADCYIALHGSIDMYFAMTAT
ncbi:MULTISPECIES: AIPR family protein [unclassified Bradyrhizobium]|uniref:AIPR family protein n=1 Tax=unclassified Bradyrhizobium TaxID=2631580 RepID=UPI0028E499F8|nr:MULTISPECIES: AIPR family protein [unclassified Bradyrhizobium]